MAEKPKMTAMEFVGHSRDEQHRPEISRMKELLTSYYGMGEDDDTAGNKPRDDPRDMNSAAFKPDLYLKELLTEVELADLLRRDDTMMKETKMLDSDMQMLVYENYNKFISATDTIRKMKDNVESMERDLQELEQHINMISDVGGGVNARLADKRSKVDKLVGVHRLLKRLEFLLELPQRLNKSVQLSQFSQAVRYYNMTSGVLARYAHISSFKAIQNDADEIMKKLTGVLQSKLKNLDAVRLEEMEEYVRLLLQLKQPRNEMRDVFLSWLRAVLGKRVDAHSSEFQERKERIAPSKLLSLLSRDILQVFAKAAAAYKDIFSTNGKLESGDQSALVSVTREVFAKYFSFLKKVFQSEKLAAEQGDAGGEGSDNNLELDSVTKAHDEEYRPLLLCLRSLLSEVQSLHGVVKAAGLPDKAAEIVEAAIRHQVSQAFLQLREKILDIVRMVHYHTLDGPAQALVREEEKDFPSFQGFLKNMPPQIMTLFVTEVEHILRKMQPLINSGSFLQSQDLGGVLPTIVQGQFQHFFVWLNRAFVLLTESPKYPKIIKFTRPGRERSGGGEGEQNRGIENRVCHPEDSSVHVPLFRQTAPRFYLVMALVVRELESQGIQRCLRTLVDCLPPTKQTSNLQQYGMDNVIDTQDVLQRTKSTAQALLSYFVELHGRSLSIPLQEHLERQNWANHKEQPREVSPIILSLLEKALAVAKEASGILGETFQLNPSRTMVNTRDLRRNLSSPSASALPPTSKSKRSVGVHLDIEKMFAQKVKVFGNVTEFTVSALISGVFIIVLKALAETVRLLSFSRFSLQQLQVDLHFLRLVLPSFSLSPLEENGAVAQLLDEVWDNLGERCLEGGSAMDQSVLVAITSTQRAKLRLE